MKKKDAENKLCPFSFNTDENTSLMMCETISCMAWSKEPTVGNDNKFGHCALIYGK